MDKKRIVYDFNIDECRSKEEFIEVMNRYVDFHNNHHPCYSIGYDAPVNYRKQFYKGELEHKNTFKQKELHTEPKFIQKRHKQALCEIVSTFQKKRSKMLQTSTFETRN